MIYLAKNFKISRLMMINRCNAYLTIFQSILTLNLLMKSKRAFVSLSILIWKVKHQYLQKKRKNNFFFFFEESNLSKWIYLLLSLYYIISLSYHYNRPITYLYCPGFSKSVTSLFLFPNYTKLNDCVWLLQFLLNYRGVTIWIEVTYCQRILQ